MVHYTFLCFCLVIILMVLSRKPSNPGVRRPAVMSKNTRSKNKAVVVSDSSDGEFDSLVTYDGVSVNLFPALINLGDRGGKFPAGSKSATSCRRIAEEMEPLEKMGSDRSCSPHMPALTVEEAALTGICGDSGKGASPAAAAAVPSASADDDLRVPLVNPQAVSEETGKVSCGARSPPREAEFAVPMLAETDPEELRIPNTFRTLAGGLVKVVLRGMDRQGHLGVTEKLLEEIRAEYPEAAENRLAVSLVPLVLQALATSRGIRRTFRRWARKANLAFPRGLANQSYDGPALHPELTTDGWSFGLWSLVSEITDRFLSQRRPVSEGAFLSGLAELIVQTSPDPVIPNLTVTTLYIVKNSTWCWPLILGYKGD